MRKILGLSFILIVTYTVMCGWLLNRANDETTEALFNAAMERAIRGEY